MTSCGPSCGGISTKVRSSSWRPLSACSTTSTASTTRCAWNPRNEMSRTLQLGLAALLLAGICRADCIPIEHAKEHVGDNVCVSGKVLNVTEKRGVRFLNFCEDYRVCPFTVVVFNRDLRDVGDIYRLAGRTIEVHGVVKLYDSRPEIILNGRGSSPARPPTSLPCPRDST